MIALDRCVIARTTPLVLCERRGQLKVLVSSTPLVRIQGVIIEGTISLGT